MESVVMLVPRRDAILVARSMIEGMCQLSWAVQDPDARPSRWRSFVWVHDWCTAKEKIARGEAVDPEIRARIEDELRRSGDHYLKVKARKARDRGAPWPDPCYDNWRCGTTVREMCESVGAEDLYRKIYEPFSDWQHGGVGKLGKALERSEDRVVYSPYSPKDTATSLAVGFQCLLQTAQLTDAHLELGFEEELSELRDGYVAWNENR